MTDQEKPMQRKYDSTVARIAGNILSGRPFLPPASDTFDGTRAALAAEAVMLARAIVAETIRTEPEPSDV